MAKAKSVVDNLDEPADPKGGGVGFAEWAMLTLHAPRIELGKYYRIKVDLLSEMPDVIEEIGPQVARRNAADLRSLAADRGYDLKTFMDELSGNGVRLLIEHRIYSSLDQAHNARMDSDRYNQRSMSETVFSSIKRTLGFAVRARNWWLEFWEMLLKATVSSLHRSVRYP